MIKVDESVAGPKLCPEFLPGDQLPGAQDQNRKNFERLADEFKFEPVFPQLTGVEIGLIRTESNAF